MPFVGLVPGRRFCCPSTSEPDAYPWKNTREIIKMFRADAEEMVLLYFSRYMTQCLYSQMPIVLAARRKVLL